MEQENIRNRSYATVILPVKYSKEISYIIPQIFDVQVGSRVKVNFANKIYSGVVREVLSGEKFFERQMQNGLVNCNEIVFKPLLEVEPLARITNEEIALWQIVADYYMCSIGEVYKAAYPAISIKQESVKPRKRAEQFFENLSKNNIPDISSQPTLSNAQEQAYKQIESYFSQEKKKPVLLKGVTGSGKTEIYINLILEQLRKGNNVLYMVPEIAISKQLQIRLKRHFGERLLTFHSKQTAAEKARIHKILTAISQQEKAENPQSIAPTSLNKAVVVLGTRSALFLPFSNLGLIIVDEEHDSSYKQTEPAPRYQARDTAIILSTIHKSNILLGSATPSFESMYNCMVGRFQQVDLNEKYYGTTYPNVEIIDTIWAYKSKQMLGSFSQKLINEIKKTISQGNQVLIFRNRRSYSPIVECSECGEIPKCPHCNVYLSYHKYNNTLRCHYCDYTTSFTGICKKCSTASLKYKGAGTEKLEEELSAILPDATIARYDADIAKSKKAEEQTIKDFAEGKIDVLIGTQMISKGFDFEKLQLVAVIQADTILGVQDFRADEKALQLFTQLMGRTGRRGSNGKLIIQTNQKNHPVFTILKNEAINNLPDNNTSKSLLLERKAYRFAPFVRMIKIIIKHRDINKLNDLCRMVDEKLSGEKKLHFVELTGPFSPVIDRIRGEYIKCFYIKFQRNMELTANKKMLEGTLAQIKGYQNIILDVDPI